MVVTLTVISTWPLVLTSWLGESEGYEDDEDDYESDFERDDEDGESSD